MGRGFLVRHSGSSALKVRFFYQVKSGNALILNHKKYAHYHDEGSIESDHTILRAASQFLPVDLLYVEE